MQKRSVVDLREAKTSLKLDGFDLARLEFDGRDHERFKNDKEYRNMSDWVEVGGGDNTAWDKKQPIQGVYVGMKTDVGPNKSNMYTLRTKDGEVDVWGSTVLDSKFENINKGMEVRIECLGEAESKAGKSYMDYKVQYREAPFQEVVDASEVSELDEII